MLKRLSLRGICLVILCILPLAAFAQKEIPPTGGKPKPFIFPAQDTYALQNGMRVTLVKYGAVPKVAMQAVVRAGLLNERPDQRWISDMVASLLKEGTTTRSAEQIALNTAEMGGNIFTSAGTDKTTIGGEVLSEFDTRFLELLSDIVKNPRFSPDDLEKIRANKVRELAINRASPGSLGWEKFRQVIFAGHPYSSVFPTDAGLKSYTLQDVKTFYYNQFGAARAHLYVVGQFDAAKIKIGIEKAFGTWKKGTEPIRDVPKINAKHSLAVIDRPGAPQSTIYLGMPAVSPSDADFIKFTVMDSLLGSSFGSRITANIRENKGYTYSPNSSNWNRYKTGYWIENADVTTEATGASIKEILYEIERLKREPPSEEELHGIKNYLLGLYVLTNSTRTGVIGQLEYVNYNELSDDYLAKYIQNLASVTPADVSDMVRKYLATEKMTLVVVGDKSKITGQLKSFAN